MDKPNGSTKVAQMVTDKVIAGLEKGNIPWHKPWITMSAQNFSSKRHYTGVNPLLLAITCEEKGYKYPVFATFNQISAEGGKVNKGEHGYFVVFTKTVKVADRRKPVNEDGEINERNIFLLRYYKVFNLDQTDLDAEKYVALNQIESYPDGDEILLRNKAQMTHGGSSASYSPTSDRIKLPHIHTFESAEEYYLTAFHELIHWTGNEKRLNRFPVGWVEAEKYSQEELVAEIGANMLMHSCGLPIVTDNSQAYINGWLSKLRGDPRFVLLAASQAQKAYDWLVNNMKEVDKS